MFAACCRCPCERRGKKNSVSRLSAQKLGARARLLARFQRLASPPTSQPHVSNPKLRIADCQRRTPSRANGGSRKNVFVRSKSSSPNVPILHQTSAMINKFMQ